MTGQTPSRLLSEHRESSGSSPEQAPSREWGGATPILVVVLIMIGLLVAAVFLLTDSGASGPVGNGRSASAAHGRDLDAPDAIDLQGGAMGDGEETQRSAAESDPKAQDAEAVPDADEEEALVGTGVSGRILGFDGSPAAGVTVTAERAVSLKEAARFNLAIEDGKQDTRFVRTVETNDDGRFAMTDLIPMGGYALRAESSSGGVGNRGDVLVVESLISDIGDIGLRLGARVRGRVRAESGGPVANASVDFSQFWNSRPVVSGADGSFDAGVLAPGRHQARVEKSGWVLPNEITLEFIEGDIVDDLELVLVPGHAISGRVMDQGGRPVPRGWVTATRQDAEREMMWFSMSRPARVRVDANGRYAFDALLPGEYALSASCPGYEDGEVNGVTAGGPTVDIELPRFATVIGVVVDASSGQPVTADELKLYWKPPWNDAGDDSMQAFWSDTAAEIGEDGAFSMGINQAGIFEVEARRDGFAPGRSDRFEVEKGATRSGVVVRLVPGRTLDATVTDAVTRAPLPGAIVELRHAAGKPAQGDQVRVVWGGSGRGAGPPSRGSLVERGVTGAAGTVAFRSIRDGEFDLFARAPGYSEATVTGAVVRPGVEPDRVQIAMTLGGAIGGVVRDDRGEALPAREVVVEGESGATAKGVSATGGRYLIEHLPPGRYKVTTDEPGLESPMSFIFFGESESSKEPDGYPVVVEEGGTAHFDLTVTIEQPGALAGSILWNGRPAEGLQVSASRIDEQKGGRGMGFDLGNMVKSDKSGGFEFRRLLPGRYRVMAGKSWNRMFTGGEATVQSGVTARLSIEIGVGGIRGRVQDASGAPIAGANVSSRPTSPTNDASPFGAWSSRRNARTAEDGTFELEELGAGRYRLAVRADGYRQLEPTEVDVQSQRISGPIDLRVVAGGWIRVLFESVAGGSRSIRLAVESEEGTLRSRSWTTAVHGGTEWVDAGGVKRGHVVVESGEDPAASVRTPFPFEMKDGENAEVRVRLN